MQSKLDILNQIHQEGPVDEKYRKQTSVSQMRRDTPEKRLLKRKRKGLARVDPRRSAMMKRVARRTRAKRSMAMKKHSRSAMGKAQAKERGRMSGRSRRLGSSYSEFADNLSLFIEGYVDQFEELHEEENSIEVEVLEALDTLNEFFFYALTEDEDAEYEPIVEDVDENGNPLLDDEEDEGSIEEQEDDEDEEDDEKDDEEEEKDKKKKKKPFPPKKESDEVDQEILDKIYEDEDDDGKSDSNDEKQASGNKE